MNFCIERWLKRRAEEKINQISKSVVLFAYTGTYMVATFAIKRMYCADSQSITLKYSTTTYTMFQIQKRKDQNDKILA